MATRRFGNRILSEKVEFTRRFSTSVFLAFRMIKGPHSLYRAFSGVFLTLSFVLNVS